ncbi:sulfotransferase domain-containing protein [Pseudomonas azerbaijanoccidentalis]
MTAFFITGSGRSGTTSLLRAIGLSSEVVIGLEPEPTLNVESRELFEGRLASPCSALAGAVVPRFADALDQDRVYIEKHLSLIPFVPYLNKLLDCKFIIPVRDGRDVVSSMIGWHNQMFPIIYQECLDRPVLSERAQSILDNQVGVDTFDYSLPRPAEDDPWHDQWASFSRFEMVAWYWSYVNNYLFDELEKLPKDRYLVVNYSNIDVDVIKRVYEFVGLSDFDAGSVAKLLDKKVNSLDDRVGEKSLSPKWKDWDADLLQRFWDIAGNAMVRLGFADGEYRPVPCGYGHSISERDPQVNRAASLSMFKAWYSTIEHEVSSILDAGCSHNSQLSNLFTEKRFCAIDVYGFGKESARVGGDCDVIRVDLIRENPGVCSDLVLSDSVIDHVYDIDLFVRKLAGMSNRYLYITCGRGYFDGISDHRYLWDKNTKLHLNEVSVKRVCEILRAEGFATVTAFPIETGREDIPVESIIVACRDLVAPEKLVAGHKLHFDFAPYRVTKAFSTAEDVVGLINAGCAYFSDSGLGLANPLSYFAQMLSDLSALKDRKIGSMYELLLGESGVNTAIRVDVDMDLVAGLEMAKISSRYQLPLTFYILHTAPYYGYMHEGTFYRHEGSAELYRDMQSLGCEIGLHVDALGLYLDHNVDGSQAVEQELAWLREQKVNVRGTSAHNCAPVYGAENFEVFKGRSIRGTPYFNRGEKYIPLGTLDELALGLEYEGSQGTRAGHFIDPALNPYLVKLPEGDFLRDPQWFKTYIMANSYNEWGCGYKIWLLGKDMWVIAGSSSAGDEVFEFDVTWGRVRDFVSAAPTSERIIFTLHPIYLGARKAAGEFPIPEGN